MRDKPKSNAIEKLAEKQYHIRMDLDCYRKEDTPYGQIINPRTIDFKPIFGENGKISSFAVLRDEKSIELQQAAFLLIWQRGNDPVFPDKGLPFAECLLGEIFPNQLMEEAGTLLLETCSTVRMECDTTDIDGTEYITFRIEAR